MLYNRNPQLNPFNMLLMRSCFALGIMIIAYNVSLKKAVWDGVNRGNVGPLIFRTIQGSTANIISLSLNKYLDLTIIAIVTNMSPLISMVLAYLILKEQVKKFEVFMLVLTIVGILIVILGGFLSPNKEQKSETVDPTLLYIMYGALLLNPFLIASGNIAMRKMKKFHMAVVSFYLNIGIATTSLIMIFALGVGFDIYKTFDWQSWALSFATGAISVSSQTARFYALKV